MEFRECYAVLIDGVLFDFGTDNNPGSVNFPFEKVWNRWTEKKFESLTLIHTHPPGMSQKSQTDINMLDGWAKTFPVPILFPIICDYHNYNVYLAYKSKLDVIHLSLGSCYFCQFFYYLWSYSIYNRDEYDILSEIFLGKPIDLEFKSIKVTK